ncbi:MAG: hypothetical protein ACQESG_01115 [Nanobdellota archaeon]
MVEFVIALGLLLGLFLSWLARSEIKQGRFYFTLLEYGLILAVAGVLYWNDFLGLAVFVLVGLVFIHYHQVLYLYSVFGIVFAYSQVPLVGFLIFACGLVTGSKLSLQKPSYLQKVTGFPYTDYVLPMVAFLALSLVIRLLLQ